MRRTEKGRFGDTESTGAMAFMRPEELKGVMDAQSSNEAPCTNTEKTMAK